MGSSVHCSRYWNALYLFISNLHDLVIVIVVRSVVSGSRTIASTVFLW